jgi:hypothetical protein
LSHDGVASTAIPLSVDEGLGTGGEDVDDGKGWWSSSAGLSRGCFNETEDVSGEIGESGVDVEEVEVGICEG